MLTYLKAHGNVECLYMGHIATKNCLLRKLYKHYLRTRIYCTFHWRRSTWIEILPGVSALNASYSHISFELPAIKCPLTINNRPGSFLIHFVRVRVIAWPTYKGRMGRYIRIFSLRLLKINYSPMKSNDGFKCVIERMFCAYSTLHC